ncbi:magnesium/cobalt transporter CorA [Pseudodesulfovibrio cashew]|uniref:Magnesium transport protein CorA n=1 Tax=Pseudodesulfovibrio cashew TaxID=2678688 RepID=A0A6I6JJF4_9BACT|nr:magnesium/cobalt transporter CorA [Pseudodesulfovibrio cashew]QGY40493.1 magnesium/cobalt transporter CorA [Pseudodesulfovibrio cashew]
MFDFLRWIHHKRDVPPGTLLYAGEEKNFVPFLRVHSYDTNNLDSRTADALDQDSLPSGRVNFVHVVGVHHPEMIRTIGTQLGFPTLALEDVMNMGQRAKLAWLDDDTGFVVMKNVQMADHRLESRQVSLFWRNGLVVVFTEEDDGLLDGILARLGKGKGKLRSTGSAYLVAAILDALVDRHLAALGELGELSEKLEASLLEETTDDNLGQLYEIKRETILLRNILMPVQDIFKALLREDAETPEEALPYLRDVAEHSAQSVEGTFALHDILKSMIDYQISMIGIRTNKVMQFLTVIATLFIPLTFIAGVYGMNFQNMPELQWRYGYFLALGLMGAVGVIMLVYFVRKKLL